MSLKPTLPKTPAPPKPRGFAAMNPERRAEISRLGGAAVDPAKRSFSKDRSLASTAGAKGGATSKRGPKKVAPE